MLLIYPPLVKPCEPPPGAARILGALRSHGVPADVLDANLEGILFLLKEASRCTEARDTWTRRSIRGLSRNLDLLRSTDACLNLDRYKRALSDVNRVLEKGLADAGEARKAWSRLRLSLSNYQDLDRSPVKSADLLRCAEHPESSPFHAYFSRRMEGLMDRLQPSVVGFSLNFLSQALPTFAMLGFLKRRYPGVRPVLGGGLITSWVRRPGWKNPFGGLVDDLVAGPGEAALLSILGQDAPGHLSKGPYPGRSAPDTLESHATPDYGQFDWDAYLAPGRILPYSASGGCYWSRCAFCPERAEHTPYVPIPTSRVMEDLDTLVRDTQPMLIHFLDNALSPALMKTLCKAPPGAPWYGFSRITHHLADRDFCRALRRSGCAMLKLGIESGDQGVLDREGKGIDLVLASRCLTALKEAGIGTYVYLLFGTPSETEAEARKTLEFTVRHSRWIDFLNLAIFNLPAYGPEASRMEGTMPYDGDLSLYTGFRHPKGWDRGLVRQFLDKEFIRHPALSPILSRDPPFFTSNHAPFLCDTFRRQPE